jgi:hypothetical protein
MRNSLSKSDASRLCLKNGDGAAASPDEQSPRTDSARNAHDGAIGIKEGGIYRKAHEECMYGAAARDEQPFAGRQVAPEHQAQEPRKKSVGDFGLNAQNILAARHKFSISPSNFKSQI